MAREQSPRSLERRFAIAAAWLTGGAVVVLALASWAWAEHLHRRSARLIAERDLQWHAVHAADAIVRIEQRLREMAASPLLQTALTDSAARVAYLQPHLESMRTIDGIPVRLALVDFEGKAVVRQSDFVLAPRERDWFMGGLSVRGTRTTAARADGQAHLWFALGIVYPRSDTVEGALWASLRVADLPQTATHRLLAGGASSALSGQTARLELPPPLDGLPLSMVMERGALEVPRDDALVLVFLSVAASLMLAAGFGARWVSRSLTRDLAALECFAGAVSLSSVSEGRAPGSGPREVANLAGSINRMLDRLREQHGALESESQQRLKMLATCISNLSDVVLVTGVSPEGTLPRFPIVFANPAFERMTGHTVAEVIGRSPALLQGPQTDRAELLRLNEALARHEAVRVELLNYAKSGTPYWVEMEIVPVQDDAGRTMHFVAIERDTTARRALEEQLREAQKLEAIGTLAGGIAHDFNNVLASILGNVALSQHDLRTGQPVDQWLGQIRKSAERARSLVEQILDYSRRRPQDRSPQELGSLVGDTVAMLRATVPAGVSILTQLPAEPVVVLGDATSIEQVLLNLGTNAWQAIAGPGGQITYGLDIETDADGIAWAHLRVQDNGCGMDEATQRRMFEPFFTTKPVGRGTGLGLAVVHGIVREHAGRIRVHSELQRGSTFHVHLPLTTQPAPAPERRLLQAASLRARVLYVDDDEVLVLVVCALLERWGCEVRTAASPEQAIAAVRAAPMEFDVVVSDYNMPGLSGAEVAAELALVRSDLPVVVTSGYVCDEMLTTMRQAGVRAVVRKERLQEDLCAVLQDVLTRDSARAVEPAPRIARDDVAAPLSR